MILWLELFALHFFILWNLMILIKIYGNCGNSYCQAQPQLQPQLGLVGYNPSFFSHPTTQPEKSKIALIQHDLQNKSCFYKWVGFKNF